MCVDTGNPEMFSPAFKIEGYLRKRYIYRCTKTPQFGYFIESYCFIFYKFNKYMPVITAEIMLAFAHMVAY